ncbi:hypothetical protein Clacol_010057 [Clathrus columnatus]|uniref:C3H1-type domain-containing protein n=1 Tax=Clathrus columnatus TaxID=1419009 RepID=A0AAV5AMF4_9AGAM|nr:hypothetical protein Clacol_010057 [Clathrus columnatus]
MSRPFRLNFAHPSSYDPLSPSYDTNAASPCNPFPTTSPFLPVQFKRSQNVVVNPLAQAPLATSAPSVSLDQHQRATILSRIPPPHSAPSLRRTKPCRFYLDVEGCKAGRWCNFKHPVGAHSEFGSSPSSLPQETWDSVPDVRDLDPNWGKDLNGDFHPKYRTQPCRNFLLGLCRFADKCQFIHPPSVFSVPPLLPLPAEFANPATIALLTNMISVSENRVDTILPLPTAKGPTRSARKTIPCINFEMDGECSHGSDCQFIHKPRATAPRIRVEVKKGNNGSTQNQRKKDISNPYKEHSRRSRSTKAGAIKEAHGIHKPTWRVVGSGVRLADLAKRDNSPGASDLYRSFEMLSLDSTVGSQSPTTFTSSPSPSSISLPSPDDILLDSSIADLSQYEFATPTHLPAGQDFFRAPSPDVPLDITMGGHEFYDLPAHHGMRKRTPLTGHDLIRQMREGDPQSYPYRESLKRCRSKPQLTIYVPPLRRSSSSVDMKRGIPGQTPFPHATEHSTGQDALEPVVELGGSHSDTESEEEEQPYGSPADNNNALYIVEEIRRPHSTPPTPWSSSHSVEVPFFDFLIIYWTNLRQGRVIIMIWEGY